MTDMTCSNNSQNYPNENIHSCVVSLNARLKQYECIREILENKLAEQDMVKSEVENLQLQLNNFHCSIENLTKKQNQQKVYEDFDAVTIKYDQNLESVRKLQQENQDIECRIQSKKVKEQNSIVKNEKLEKTKTKIIKRINGLQQKIENELACSAVLKIKQIDLEQVMSRSMEEEQKACQELANIKAGTERLDKQLLEMQQNSSEIDRNIKELKAKCYRRKADLTELQDRGQKWLVKADHDADAVVKKLADVYATMVDWKSKGEQLETAYLQMMSINDEERGRTRVMLKVINDERDALNCRMAEISCELAALTTDNQHLVVTSKNEAERLNCLIAQIDKIEQQNCHDRLIHSVQRLKRDSEMTLLKNVKSVKDNKLLLVENEVEELRRSSYSCALKNDVPCG